MPDDIQTVIYISRIFLIIAGICTTVFPLLYFVLSAWYKTHLGRAVMIQSMSIAFAVDISVLFQFITTPTNLLAILIINVVILSFIAGASIYLTVMLIFYNFQSRKEYIKDGERNLAEYTGETVPE